MLLGPNMDEKNKQSQNNQQIESQCRKLIKQQNLKNCYYKENCQKCGQKNIIKKSEFININDIMNTKNSKYLCVDCSHIYPTISIREKSQCTELMNNITINRNHENAVQMSQYIKKLFQSLILKKIKQIENMMEDYIKKLKFNLYSEFEAVAGTFTEETLNVLRQCAINTHHYHSQEVELVVQAAKYSGLRNLSNVSELLTAVKRSYDTINGHLEDECKTIRNQFNKLMRHIQRSQIHQLYQKNLHRYKMEMMIIDEINESYRVKKEKGQICIEIKDDQSKEQQKECGNIIDVNFQNGKILKWSHAAQAKELYLRYQITQEFMLEYIIKCINIEYICIQNHKYSNKMFIKFFIENFPHLQRLQISCYNDVDEEIINTIIKKVPQIKEFYVGCNFYRNLAHLDQLHNFRQNKLRKRRSSFNAYTLSLMLASLPKLRNIWISELFHHNLNNQLLQCHIQQIVLGKYDCQQQKKIDQQSWHVFSQLKGLKSIAFIKIILQPKFVLQILKNNSSTLQCLYFYCCRDFNDEISYNIKQYCPNVRQLYMYRCGQVGFKGNDVFLIKKLDTLILRQCQSPSLFCWDSEFFITNKTNILKLKHLNLMGNPWLPNDFLKYLKNNKMLQCLILGNTNITITQFTKQIFYTLTEIRSIHLGRTKIKGDNVIEICTNLSKLTKLNLEGLQPSQVVNGRGVVHTKQIERLSHKNITHLDISHCKQIEGYVLEKFKKLKFINVTLATKVNYQHIKQLQKKGIIVFNNIQSEFNQ